MTLTQRQPRDAVANAEAEGAQHELADDLADVHTIAPVLPWRYVPPEQPLHLQLRILDGEPIMTRLCGRRPHALRSEICREI